MVQEEVIRQSKKDNSVIHSFIHSRYLWDNSSDPNPELGAGTCWTSQRAYNLTRKGHQPTAHGTVSQLVIAVVPEVSGSQMAESGQKLG